MGLRSRDPHTTAPSRAIVEQGPGATPRGVTDRKWIGYAKDAKGEI